MICQQTIKGRSMTKELTWRKAIEKVLGISDGAMHYKDIAEQIVSEKLRKNVGATPSAMVAVTLSNSILKDSDKSPFQKVGRGEYILRAKGIVSSPNASPPSGDKESNLAAEVQYEIITSFGMFWRRNFVDWSANTKLLGMQQLGAEAVDFGKQIGIYLLYDGREIIYVGRSTDRPLGKRLYEHTADRLSIRWDRFSWFGLLLVSNKGKLGILPDEYAADKMIPALEAILIEALEPRQNRKRGDDLSAVEYLQKEDPEIDRKKQTALLESVLKKHAKS
jgi:HB1/ASXL restriction endonuclease-like protein with HTH domain